MINNIFNILYLIIILLILKILIFNKYDNVQNNITYDYINNNNNNINNDIINNNINNNNNNKNKHKKKQINKCVRFNEKSNEYYDNNNPEIYNFHYESSHCELPFMNNLNSWYNNTWIDHFDSDDNPVYKSSNTDINNSTILIDKDIDYTKDTIGSKRFNNKSIKDIYNSLIFNY